MKVTFLMILVLAVVAAKARFLQIIKVGDKVYANDLEQESRAPVEGPPPAPAPIREQSFIYQNRLTCSDDWCAFQCLMSGYLHGKCYGENYCSCWN